MEIDKVKEAMKTEEGRAAVQDFLKDNAGDLGFVSKDDVDGLVNKKNELLGKLAKMKKNTVTDDERALVDTLREYGIMDIEGLKGLKEKEEGKSQAEIELAKMKRDYPELKTRFEKEHEARKKAEKRFSLIRELEALNVDPETMDVLVDYFDKKTGAEIEDDGKIKIVGYDADGLSLPLQSFIKDWSKTEQAKRFIRAPESSGGGSGGPGGTTEGTTMKRKDFEALSPEEQMKTATSGVKIID